VLMKALQILRFRYKQEHLDLVGSLVTRVEELTLDDPDIDVTLVSCQFLLCSPSAQFPRQ
ncbi:hypothetical protein BD310DRAFT_823680, partial [Dichomitus squalens]